MPQNIYEAIWIFLIYAFLGWCTEVAFAAVTKGKFVNRGFLNGPVCPIYGFGMLIVVTLLWGLRYNLILLFLGSAALTTALEFITGYVLEKFFHDKWWDYADKPFNIRGYICLEFTILWGLAASFVVGAVHPFVYTVITKIPFVIGVILLAVFLGMFAADLIITVLSLVQLSKRMKRLAEIQNALKAISDKIGEDISDTAIAAKEKSETFAAEKKPQLDELRAEYEKKKAEYKKLRENHSFIHKRIFKAFPRLKEGKFKDILKKELNRERTENEKNSL